MIALSIIFGCYLIAEAIRDSIKELEVILRVQKSEEKKKTLFSADVDELAEPT